MGAPYFRTIRSLMPRLLPFTGFAVLGLLAAAAYADKAEPAFTLTLPKSAAPSSMVKATLKVVIPAGWHAYQNPPSKDYQIPLTIEAGDKTLKSLKVTYPKGEESEVAGETSAVYNGTLEIPVTFKAAAKTGKQAIKLKVGWQMCDHGSCLPPNSGFVTGTLTIVKPAKTPPVKAKP